MCAEKKNPVLDFEVLPRYQMHVNLKCVCNAALWPEGGSKPPLLEADD